MDPMAARFAECWKSRGFTIPDEDVRARRAGHIARESWLIQYCFGRDDAGEHLDFYATNRFSGDSHYRIHADGSLENLPELVSSRTASDDPVEDKRLEEEFLRENREVAEALAAKGFGLFTINMALSAGLVDPDQPTEPAEPGAGA
jgi:hypothetical protein